MHLRHKARKATIFAVTALGALALTLGSAASAVAAPVVDPNATGSITIEKLQQPDTDGLPATGVQDPAITGTPIPDVTFVIHQVTGIDLTTNAGWNAAAAMTVTQARSQLSALVDTQTTDGDGIAKFDGLPVGMYLIEETVVPTGVTPGDPFLVTIPMTDPTDSANWMYDVYIYPKDGFATANKTVADADAVALGDPVDFTITSSLPNVDVIDGFKVVDALDSRLDYLSTDVTMTKAGSPALVFGTDYSVSEVNNVVTVLFSDAGLLKLAADPVGNSLQVVIHTTVNAVGEITNQALVYSDKSSFDITPGEPGGPISTDPDLTTKWGNIVVSKVDAGNAAKTIPGVDFQVFASQADAIAGTNPITIDGVSTWTTNSSGLAVISGLRYSGWADGAAVNPGDPGYQSYWLVETKAADGYALLAEPVEVVVDSDSVTVPTATIKNSPLDPNLLLPMTGGALSATSVLVYVAGGLLLAGAVTAVVYIRRRAAKSNA